MDNLNQLKHLKEEQLFAQTKTVGPNETSSPLIVVFTRYDQFKDNIEMRASHANNI